MARVQLLGKNNSRTVALPHLSVSMTAESNALAAATTANWLDVQGWRDDLGNRDGNPNIADEQWFTAYPQFEIDIECDAAETLTGTPKLYACRLAPVTIADDTFTSSGSDDINTATSHGMLTGDGPFQLTTTDTLPAGLSLATDYYARSLSANTFSLHPTRADAVADTNSIATTDTGTGTHTIADVQGKDNGDQETRRFHFALVGELNEGSDITLGAQVSYMERINHSPLDLYYVPVATQTNIETVTVRVTPILPIEE